ncbi:MAG: SsrA-binding protein SmpB [SAR324 cluster bacterium]|nr:SsrA-binding protein SmpB [SAR324 cluster bacterium]
MSIKVIAKNRRARFEYEVLQTFETGIVLKGTEVKSLRDGRVNMGDSHCRINAQLEVFLVNLHISPYEYGNRVNHEPLRERKLLLHKNEIRRLYGLLREKGLTLVPLKMYLNRGNIKIELGLVRGKKLHDKRENLKKKEMEREVERNLKSFD